MHHSYSHGRAFCLPTLQQHKSAQAAAACLQSSWPPARMPTSTRRGILARSYLFVRALSHLQTDEHHAFRRPHPRPSHPRRGAPLPIAIHPHRWHRVNLHKEIRPTDCACVLVSVFDLNSLTRRTLLSKHTDSCNDSRGRGGGGSVSGSASSFAIGLVDGQADLRVFRKGKGRILHPGWRRVAGQLAS